MSSQRMKRILGGVFDWGGVVFSGALLVAVTAQATVDIKVRMKGCFIVFWGLSVLLLVEKDVPVLCRTHLFHRLFNLIQ